MRASSLLLVALLAPGWAATQTAADNPQLFVWTPDSAGWVSTKTVTDAQEASFDRRLFIGSIWSARLWPPGFQLVMDAPPRHGRYLVVSGTLRIDIEDHGVHDFSTGSFVEIIGPVRHTVSCTSSSDCVFYAIPSWMDALAARPRKGSNPTSQRGGICRIWPYHLLDWISDDYVQDGKKAPMGGFGGTVEQVIREWAGGRAATFERPRGRSHAVVLGGTLLVALPDGHPSALPPGSCFEVAPGTTYTLTCESGDGCLFYHFASRPARRDAELP